MKLANNVLDSINESNYLIHDMALVSFTDVFANEMDNRREEGLDDFGYKPERVELTEYTKDFLKENELGDKFLPMKEAKKLFDAMNSFMKGKITVSEVVDSTDTNFHTTSVLQSVGHGVNITDEPNVEKLLKDKGVDIKELSKVISKNSFEDESYNLVFDAIAELDRKNS